jgi:hypothetical protein
MDDLILDAASVKIGAPGRGEQRGQQSAEAKCRSSAAKEALPKLYWAPRSVHARPFRCRY